MIGASYGVINPIVAAMLHNAGSLIVVFNSARLVRVGEELEAFDSGADKPNSETQASPASQSA